jgi:Protein of unknown function (DUF1353)
MKKILLAILVTMLHTVSNAQFVGKLEFMPKDCESTGKCTLVYDFGYIDPMKVGWQANAGLVTDGATIPFWAKPFIGGSFEKDFIKAAVIHDWYCDRSVRAWTQTHRVFYDALIASGVDSIKAKMMYYAVLVGGPKWLDLIKGKECKVGETCINNVNGNTRLPDGNILNRTTDEKYIYRKARYGEPAVISDITAVKSLIEANNAITPEALEDLAKTRNPNDLYFKNGNSIFYQDNSSSFQRE